ncbi:hypothetical protein U1Q18_039228 [Sarracenia purpurea var. burkii]
MRHPGQKAGKSETSEIFPYWTPIQYSILKRPLKKKEKNATIEFLQRAPPWVFLSVVGFPVRKLKESSLPVKAEEKTGKPESANRGEKAASTDERDITDELFL